jgi:catechol 2,3-dioxygenase-like lactoylglutathione lyase family enzyme
MKVGKTTPILRILDEAKAREFYLGWLGFELVFEHRFEPGLPLYMGIRRGDCMLHLSEHHGDACPGASMRIEVGDIDALAAELNARLHRYARPTVATMPWGTRDMTLADPFGNRLTFTDAISV